MNNFINLLKLLCDIFLKDYYYIDILCLDCQEIKKLYLFLC